MNRSTASLSEAAGSPAAAGDDRPAARRRRARAATPPAPAAARPSKPAKPAKAAQSSAVPRPPKADKSKAAASGARKAPKSPKPPKAPSAVPAATAKPERVKLVRDSFTMPKSDVDLLAALKQRCLKLGHEAKKSELVRAGLHALAALQDDALVAIASSVPRLKTGRPGQKKGK